MALNYDVEGNELFEGDIIQICDAIYKVCYSKDRWYAEFIERLTPLNINEFPKFQYTGSELWGKIAKLIRRGA